MTQLDNLQFKSSERTTTPYLCLAFQASIHWRASLARDEASSAADDSPAADEGDEDELSPPCAGPPTAAAATSANNDPPISTAGLLPVVGGSLEVGAMAGATASVAVSGFFSSTFTIKACVLSTLPALTAGAAAGVTLALVAFALLSTRTGVFGAADGFPCFWEPPLNTTAAPSRATTPTMAPAPPDPPCFSAGAAPLVTVPTRFVLAACTDLVPGRNFCVPTGAVFFFGGGGGGVAFFGGGGVAFFFGGGGEALFTGAFRSGEEEPLEEEDFELPLAPMAPTPASASKPSPTSTGLNEAAEAEDAVEVLLTAREVAFDALGPGFEAFAVGTFDPLKPKASAFFATFFDTLLLEAPREPPFLPPPSLSEE